MTSGFPPPGLRQSASLVPGLPHLWHMLWPPQETETIVTPVFRVRTVGPRARHHSTQRRHRQTGGQAHGASLASRVQARAWPGTEAHLITGPAATQEEAVRVRIRSPTVTRFGYLQVQRLVPSALTGSLAFLASLATLRGCRVSHQRGVPPGNVRGWGWGACLSTIASPNIAPACGSRPAAAVSTSGRSDRLEPSGPGMTRGSEGHFPVT